MSIITDLQDRQGESREDLFKLFLGNVDILDFGYVLNVYERSPDEASACDGLYLDTQVLDGRILENVELLAPGAGAAAVFCKPIPGDAVLLVGLKRHVASVENGAHYSAGIFSAENVKALPLGRPGSAALRLLVGESLAFSHKRGALGLDADGAVFSRSVSPEGEVTRDERFYPDGSLVKRYNHGRALERRSADYSNTWTLYDESMRILEYERRDMAGARTVKTGENTSRDTAFADKQWRYERTTTSKPAHTERETIKAADGKILRREVRAADGGMVYSYFEQTEQGEDFLVTQTIRADGSYERVLTDADGKTVNKIAIAADGAVELVVGDSALTARLLPDGSLTYAGSGDITVAADGKLAFKSNIDGLLTIGNSIATIGSIMTELFTALQGLHTEGSPAAHTASTWYTASVAPIKTKADKVFN